MEKKYEIVTFEGIEEIGAIEGGTAFGSNECCNRG